MNILDLLAKFLNHLLYPDPLSMVRVWYRQVLNSNRSKKKTAIEEEKRGIALLYIYRNINELSHVEPLLEKKRYTVIYKLTNCFEFCLHILSTISKLGYFSTNLSKQTIRQTFKCFYKEKSFNFNWYEHNLDKTIF